MKSLEPISKIMTSNIIILNIDDQLTKAEELFKKYKIRHLPVVDGCNIVGILSYTDLQKVCFTDSLENNQIESIVYNSYTLEQVMSKNVMVVTPWTPIKEVATILSKAEFRALPVAQEGNIVGIVSTVDLLKYYISQYDE